MSKCFVQAFGPHTRGLLCGAAGPSQEGLLWATRALRSPGQRKISCLNRRKNGCNIDPCNKSLQHELPPASAAAALRGEHRPRAWEGTEGTVPGHAGPAPSLPATCLPGDILVVMSQTAPPAKRTVQLGVRRCKTLNTGMSSLAKSLSAGCAGCLGS